jgi:tetratricopeptide (TPR) repeat protein/Tol biopolymer transport system component
LRFCRYRGGQAVASKNPQRAAGAPTQPRTSTSGRRLGFVGLAIALVALGSFLFLSNRNGPPSTEAIMTFAGSVPHEARLEIEYPLDGTLFPPDIVAPTFLWSDPSAAVDQWFVLTRFSNSDEVFRFSTNVARWRPTEKDWERIKGASRESDAEIVIVGVDGEAQRTLLSSSSVHIRTSKDEVHDSIFYREVPLPFLEAVQDPSRIRWRLGSVDSQDGPPIVLQDLPVCGNCHSFSAKGKVLGLDVDYGNDKGAYAIISVEKEMVMKDSNIITWADYDRDDGELTFGLLSQVSPDGRYVVSTVKDRSVFVATPDIAFSQLFFPIKGILVVYDRQTKIFQALPGADDPTYVQSNPSWSPDGKEIVFARAKAYELANANNKNSVIIDEVEVPEFISGEKSFRYDLYKIPFNEGKGGVAEPLAGASDNGMSNFFAQYSPVGKWIVFCKAASFMLLQPDSELFIIPAIGGTARRLRANTSLMNSWHSWSSNSRWLVFSSKVNTPYTQLFLTHIDENGVDTPAVLLERFTSSDRAANIPVFVDMDSDAITQISEDFLDAYSFLRAGTANERTGDYPGAKRSFRRGLEIEPENVDLRNALGWTLFQEGQSAKAIAEYERALAVDAENVKANNNIALALTELGKLDRAASHFERSLAVEPKAEIYSDLGFVLDRQGKGEEAVENYHKALELDPECASAHINLAVSLLRRDRLDEAAAHYESALRVKPTAETHNGLGFVLSKQGKVDEAIAQFREAIRADPKYTAAYNNLAGNLIQQGKLSEAASYYRTSLDTKPNAILHNQLGAVLMRLGRADEAAQEFRKAIAMNPGYAEALRNLEAVGESRGR